MAGAARGDGGSDRFEESCSLASFEKKKAKKKWRRVEKREEKNEALSHEALWRDDGPSPS